MKKTLTIFTPTYNRAYTLHKCYESLKRQTNKDFTWLIIDDGSTDDTKKIVDRWIAEDKVELIYHYQNNQGMHGAHNTAYELIDTELNVCIDSDDYMTDDAVEKIIKFWNENKSEDIAGIIGLDIYENGNVVGSQFPEGLGKITLFDINNKYKISGDKKLVYRTELIKKYPYPIFNDERYVGLAYKYYKIDETHKLLPMNEQLCVVEYLEDGSSRNMMRQYKRNPKGFAFYRIENMKNPKATIKFKFKECVHYVSSSLISKNKKFIQETPCKVLTVAAIPLGLAMYAYIMMKASEGN